MNTTVQQFYSDENHWVDWRTLQHNAYLLWVALYYGVGGMCEDECKFTFHSVVLDSTEFIPGTWHLTIDGHRYSPSGMDYFDDHDFLPDNLTLDFIKAVNVVCCEYLGTPKDVSHEEVVEFLGTLGIMLE